MITRALFSLNEPIRNEDYKINKNKCSVHMKSWWTQQKKLWKVQKWRNLFPLFCLCCEVKYHVFTWKVNRTIFVKVSLVKVQHHLLHKLIFAVISHFDRFNLLEKLFQRCTYAESRFQERMKKSGKQSKNQYQLDFKSTSITLLLFEFVIRTSYLTKLRTYQSLSSILNLDRSPNVLERNVSTRFWKKYFWKMYF